MSINIRKKINKVTAPIRVLYASIAVVWWEILTLGALPNIKMCWRFLYEVFEFSADDEDVPTDIM